MSDYPILKVDPSDHSALAQVDALLSREGLQRDANLDYTCAMYDRNCHIIATGSCFGNTLRCLAVGSSHQGEGLLNEILTHLIDVQYERGNIRLFLYTKIKSARFFEDLGFYEIARVDDALVFMENRKNGFTDYLKGLVRTTDTVLYDLVKGAGADASPDISPSCSAKSTTPLQTTGYAALTSASKYPRRQTYLTHCPRKSSKKTGALVMNANPFTLGHQYLAEKAASHCDLLHLFLVSEDTSLIPFSVRKKLVLDGVSHLPNIICHDSGPYIISNATFPSYFLKDEETVIKSHAKLDLAVFTQIAKALSITSRYVGEEPYSQVTSIYNQIMASELPSVGIDCIIVPRKEADGSPISASRVRQYLKEKNFEALGKLVPKSTLDYFKSNAAVPVIERICRSENVVHY